MTSGTEVVAVRGLAELRERLRRIDGKGYKAYKDLEGEYDLGVCHLYIDHVQADPFAPPSRLRVRVDQAKAQFPPDVYSTVSRRTAAEDFLAREYIRALAGLGRERRGTGHSGLIGMDRCGQEVLQRTFVVLNDQFVEARIVVGLPAFGRTIAGRQAEAILTGDIPRLAEKALMFANLNQAKLRDHVKLNEAQDQLRLALPGRGLVAFIGNGSVLPRESGVSDRPLTGPGVIPFQSPPEFAVELPLPDGKTITGMGIPAGVTLLTGGGYHGKSTVLRAIERGVYNHIAGDGREFVLTVPGAFKIRAEDGRVVTGVDISPFINNLPFGRETRSFSTQEASGSTSQAANIIEALEMGANLLLLDEDTSATNFMIRDARMQALVAREKEPITPFIDRVRQLYDEFGVSSILVVGGSGDYLDVADHVIMMDEYRPRDVTGKAREVAERFRTARVREQAGDFQPPASRVPLPASINPAQGHRVKVDAKGLSKISFGQTTIDLDCLEQLVDPAQTRAIAAAILYGLNQGYIDGRRSLREIVSLIAQDLATKGLDVLSPYKGQHPGYYALPRPLELAAAINRLRTLQCRPRTG